MNALETLRVAFLALLRNKTRSVLTTLGVVIGVAAVIAMTAIGAGAKARVDNTFGEMGATMLTVRSGSSAMGGQRGGVGSQLTLTWTDLEAIRSEAPLVRFAAPRLQINSQVMAEGQNWSTAIQGTTPEYFVIRNWSTAQGSWFTDADVDAGAKVAVLGQTVAAQLFGPYVDPVGEVIRLRNVPFEVIGVAAAKGVAGPGGDNDDVVFIPVTTYRAKLRNSLQQFIEGQIAVGAVSPEAATEAQRQVEDLLRRRHKIADGGQDDFSVRNLAELAVAQQEGARTMTSLLAGIALVSLLVGGIGIMNIMLVSVSERTREIGLRLAVGARPRQILTQFLVEAVSLSLLGGLLGTAVGLGTGSYLAAHFDWPMLVQPFTILFAVAFSGVVGVGFGLYPAWRASQLDPIVALRYE